MTQIDRSEARLPAAVVALTPAVLLAGLLAHPFIPVLPDNAAVAAAVAESTTRWAIAHLTVGLASAFVILAFLAIHGYLRRTGDARWSARGVPWIVVGSTLYTVLTGMEFAPLAAVLGGGDAQAAQAALAPWFVPTLASGGVIFAIGVLAFAKGIADSGVLTPHATWVVVTGLVVLAAARLVPLGAVQFNVQGVAWIIALWPLAARMWERPRPEPAARPHAPLAT